MKSFMLIVAVMFMAAGCTNPTAGYERASGLSMEYGRWSSANVRDAVSADSEAMIAAAQAEAIKNESHVKIKFAELDAEGRKSLMVAQAQYLGAIANRIQFSNPGRQEVVRKFIGILEEYSSSTNVEKQGRLLDAATALAATIESPSLAESGGVPMMPYGGMGGLLFMSPGVRIPVGGNFISPAATNQPGFGALWNNTPEWQVRGYVNGEFVGDAGPGQPIPCVMVPDGINPIRMEAYNHGLLVGVYETTFTPNPRSPSHRKPYQWTHEVGALAFRRP